MKQSFYSWMLQFKSDNSPIGDFARDAELDKNFPRRAGSYKYLRKYLESIGACGGALSAFEEAFNCYQENMERIAVLKYEMEKIIPEYEKTENDKNKNAEAISLGSNKKKMTSSLNKKYVDIIRDIENLTQINGSFEDIIREFDRINEKIHDLKKLVPDL